MSSALLFGIVFATLLRTSGRRINDGYTPITSPLILPSALRFSGSGADDKNVGSTITSFSNAGPIRVAVPGLEDLGIENV